VFDNLLLRSITTFMAAASLWITSITIAAPHPTDHTLTRVFQIQAGTKIGTAFTIEVDGREYLITAKHVVSELLNTKNEVQICRSDGQCPAMEVTILRCDDPIDIAILVLRRPMSPRSQVRPELRGLVYGQDIFFLGFPFGLNTMLGTDPHYPVPLIKKGTASGEVRINGATVILIDGHNNPGFSGGPVVYRDLANPSGLEKIAGVVSGFRNDLSPVFSTKKIQSSEVSREDIVEQRVQQKGSELLRLTETNDVVRANTGIVIAYAIDHAIDLIKKNPVGPTLSAR
jgi:hypothetical protein